MQSNNEELETSKEEIQSSNEELATVNDELINRIAESNRVNNDLINLIGCVQMAIVMVGPELRVRRFTPLAEKLLNLIRTDGSATGRHQAQPQKLVRPGSVAVSASWPIHSNMESASLPKCYYTGTAQGAVAEALNFKSASIITED